jgi:alpha-tubulin suppressor-like RCC1 family protein
MRVSSASAGRFHAVALAEDGLVYAWGKYERQAVLGNPNVKKELLPKPVETLRGVRIGSIVAAGVRTCTVSVTGEVWTWGCDRHGAAPLGHGERVNCPLPTPIESLRGVKVDAVAADDGHTLVQADDGSLYAWGGSRATKACALGLGGSCQTFRKKMDSTPTRLPSLRTACGL